MKIFYLLLAFVILAPLVFAADITTELKAYYTMDGNADDSLGVYDGTVNGATLVAGKQGQAYSCDGLNDYIALGDIDTTALSVSMWVYNRAATESLLIAKRSSASYAWEMTTGSVSAGYSRARINSNTYSASYNRLVNPGVWTHFVLTYSTADRIRLYINGTQRATYVYSTAMTQNNVIVDLCRRGYVGAEGYFNGSVDEIGIWNKMLNTTEIAYLWNGGAGVTYNDMIGLAMDVNLTSPKNNTHLNNQNVTLNYSIVGPISTPINCTIKINKTGNPYLTHNDLNIANGSHYYYNNSWPEDTYTWAVNCTTTGLADNTPISHFIIDRTNPIYTEKRLNILNQTIITSRAQPLQNFSGYWFDTYMFGWNQTIAKIGGTTYYTNQTTGLTSTLAWVNKTLNISSWPSGWYYANNTGSDDHTRREWNPTDVVVSNQDITFYVNNSWIKLDNTQGNMRSIDFNCEDYDDRCGFSFEPNNNRNRWIFEVSSNNKLFYRGGLYTYPTFVASPMWVDFVTNSTDVNRMEVATINQYTQRITIYMNSNNRRRIYFHSIGGLNIAHANYRFKIDYEPMVTLTSPVSNQKLRNTTITTTFFLNDTDSTNINCTLYLNGAFNKNILGLSTGTHTTTFNPAQGNNSFYVACSDGVSTATTANKYVFIDSVKPTYQEQTISTLNITQFPKDHTYQQVGNWTDNVALGLVNVTVRNSTGAQLFFYNKTNIVNASYLLSVSINMNGWPTGVYTIHHQAQDLYNLNWADYSYKFTIVNNVTRYFYQAMMTVRLLP